MNITMNDSRITTVSQLKTVLKGTQGVDLSLRDAAINEKYQFISQTIKRLKYRHLRKKDKRIVRQYLKKITGYKHTQLNRLIKRAKQGDLMRTPYHRTRSYRTYNSSDIKLLERTDELHLRLSEKATQEILKREHNMFGREEYKTISHVSHSHITNLRQSPLYQNSWINHTKARVVPIGITQKPDNQNKPGSIRVDTVHQRDVYHINSVDEITQWEVVVCVAQICEATMIPALQYLLSQFPFVIFNFHSDRGGETINYTVSDLLNRLIIKQTKSRARHTNDNALVEMKNGQVIRKNMGWVHINQEFADDINRYYHAYFNPYLNFHRPCAYPTTTVDKKGKEHKQYKTYQIPYEALKALPHAKDYLKKDLTFAQLDTIAYAHSDNEFAKVMREEERKLFNKIYRQNNKHGSQRKRRS